MSNKVFSTKAILAMYFQTVDLFHSQQKAPAADCALRWLLEQYEDVLCKDNAFHSDPTGLSFHKSFRSQVLDNQAETSIWFLLHAAPLFWEVVNNKSELVPLESKTRLDYEARDFSTDSDENYDEKEMTMGQFRKLTRNVGDDATVEVRGNVEEGYLTESKMGIDTSNNSVILDL